MRRRRKANRGWFKKGHDPRRKRGFPRWACRKGFRVAVCRHPHLLEWLMARFLTGRDKRRRREAGVPW